MINQQTGHIQFSDTVSIGPHTTEASLLNLMILYIDSKQDLHNGYSAFAVSNIPLNKMYFNFNFTFREGLLNTIRFRMNELPFIASGRAHQSEEEELQQLDKYKRWLRDELENRNTFTWGTVSATRDPEGGGSFIGIAYRQTGTVHS